VALFQQRSIFAFLLNHHIDTASTSTCATANDGHGMTTPRWYQKTISITAPSRGCHLITPDILKAVKDELASIHIGMANIFIQHTSASLTINENADSDVRRDMEVALNRIGQDFLDFLLPFQYKPSLIVLIYFHV
jgi:hypothetical protein